MIKKLITLFLLCSPLFANEYLKITSNKKLEYHDHETYESWYDVEYHNPAVVIWDLTFEDAKRSEAASDTRASKFTKCTNTVSTQTYTNTGYDRGHMCPNNDRDWNKESSENTFRMCNVTPQTDKLNRGSWKKYEKYGHDLAYKHMLVTIACGPLYIDNLKSEIWISNNEVPTVRVPDAFFKIFVIDGKIIETYIFYQDGSMESSSVEEIEKLANIKFEVIK